MVSINSALLQTWIITLLWPLSRVLAMIAVAPIFSHMTVPVRVKLGLGLLITFAIMPTLPTMPYFEVFSLQALALLIEQIMIGLCIGFTMRLVFSAVEFAGFMIGMTMGLGFASFFDPQTQGQSTAISQFLVLLALLVFLSLDGHLVLVTTVAHSFITMPIQLTGMPLDFMKMALWGETVFSAGLTIALPVIAALLVTNMALGILTKTAPQLNLFGIGFPVTISIGFIVLAISIPSMVTPLERMIEKGSARMLEVSK